MDFWGIRGVQCRLFAHVSGVYQALNRICFSGIAQELCGFEFVIDVGTSMMNMSLELWFRILESALQPTPLN